MCDSISAQIDFIQGENILRRCICDRVKGTEFTLNGALRRHKIGNLNEALFSVPNRDEIDFSFMGLSREDSKALEEQFIIDDVFQKEGILEVDRIRMDRSESGIYGIVFLLCLKSCFPNGIILLNRVDQERFLHLLKIVIDRALTDASMVFLFVVIHDAFSGEFFPRI